MSKSIQAFIQKSWPVLLLAALAVLFLGDVWFGGRILLLRDFFFGEETTRLLIGKTLLGGKLPLWSSLSQCGVPFLASPYSCALYPPNWIFILPSVEWASRLWWTSHLVLAAASCYALARYWRMGVAPALFAAVSFTFSTYITAWIEFSLAFYCMAWGILALLLVSLIIDRTAEAVLHPSEPGTPLRWRPLFLRNAAPIAGLAIVLALQVLASGEIFYYTSLMVATYGFARWAWHGSWKACGISMLWIGLAGLLALGMAMPQLLPTFEMMGFSVRAGVVDPALDMTSEHPRHWLAMLLPYLYGRPGYPNAYWAPSLYEFANGTCYVGILPLMAACFCWLKSKKTKLDREARERRFLIRFMTAVLIAGLALAAGKYTPVYGFLHNWLPGLGHFRFPTKLHFYVVFAWSMLGALGLQSLLLFGDKSAEASRVRVWKIGAVGFGVLILGYLICLFNDGFLVGLMGNPKTPSVMQVNAAMADYSWAVAFTVAGLALFAMLAFRRGPLQWAPAGIVAVAFINLCVISRQAQPTGPAGIYNRRPVTLAKRMGNDPMYRYYSNYGTAHQWVYGDNRTDIWEWAVEAGATNHLLLEGFSTLTPDGLPLSRYTRFFGTVMSAPPQISAKLADMLSLRYVIGGAPFEQILWGNASREVKVGERPGCLPRAFVVSQWRAVQGEEPVFQTIVSESFHPQQEAVVEPLPGGPALPLPEAGSAIAPGEQAGEVRSFVDQGDSVTLEVTAKTRALLVLGDTWYPGWTAKVDGIERPIFQANYLFRGVFLEPGTHRVEFTFASTWLSTGLWLCLGAAAICVSLLGASRFAPASAPIHLPQVPVESAKGKRKAHSA